MFGLDEADAALPHLDLPPLRGGEVWLVGAGPGDPGLLTLHALHAIRSADVIVHDALVGERVLGLARTGAVLDYAGKRGGRPSCTQGAITERLIGDARRGRRVVRLKGGDPFVFGRGAEEALALEAAGVPFRIVPGVTAGIGGLAYAGIPVTSRDTNHAVTFVTGHGEKGRLPDDLDWAALAKGAGVLVFYMGLRTAGAIAGALMAHGRPADEPAAIVSRASTSAQSVIETTLGTLAEDLARAEPSAPALIVVGEVVRLRARLDWLSRLPPETGSARDLAALRAVMAL